MGNVVTDVVWTYNEQEEMVSPPSYGDMLAISSTGYVYSVMYKWSEQRQMIQVDGFNIGSMDLSIVLDPTVRVIATLAVSSLVIAAFIYLAKKWGVIKT